MGSYWCPALAVSQAVFAGSQHGFQVNLVQRKPPGHPSECQPNQCTSLIPPSTTEEQACAGHNIEQPKNFSVEQDAGMTVIAVVAHGLLISACQKQQKGLMVVDGGTLPSGLSVTLQCPHYQAPKMSTCSVNTRNLHPPSWHVW